MDFVNAGGIKWIGSGDVEMSIQTETDAILMRNWAKSTIEDLERGIANFDRWAQEASIDYTHRAKSRELGHMADLLRAELKRRMMNCMKDDQALK
jgi:hypothetical protein